MSKKMVPMRYPTSEYNKPCMGMTIMNNQTEHEIADKFLDWRLTLTPEKQALTDAHMENLKGIRGLGDQGRMVVLTVIYLWWHENVTKGFIDGTQES